MAAPALWIGLGEYGDRVISGMEGRRALLDESLASSRPARPCTLWAAGDGSIPASIPPDLDERVLAALPQSTRRGNMRGPCYEFVVAHANDLLDHPELADARHWVWSIPRRFDFSGSRLVLLVCTDGMRAGGRDSRSVRVWAQLSAIASALTAAGTRDDWLGQVVTVEGTAPDWGGVPVSQEAISLLADLLDAVWDDPDGDSTLGLLLGIGLAALPDPALPGIGTFTNSGLQSKYEE
ncbi:MAG: hypothetical protein WCH74_15465 [Chloroflexota bacterium]